MFESSKSEKFSDDKNSCASCQPNKKNMSQPKQNRISQPKSENVFSSYRTVNLGDRDWVKHNGSVNLIIMDS